MKYAILFRWPGLLGLLLVSATNAQQLPPLLNISKSDDGITLSWPVSAYYFVLEQKPNPSPSAPWSGVTTASKLISDILNFYPGGYALVTTNIVGGNITAMFPATNDMQFFRLKGASLIPVFQFNVFYNGLLEFSTASTLFISGPVHANGSIYTGSASPATFSDTVTTASTISSPANNGQGSNWIYKGTFNGNPSSVTNVSTFLLPGLGTNNAHALIDTPLKGEAPTSALGQMRLFNQAQVVLLVGNDIGTNYVIARIQAGSGQLPGADLSPVILTATSPFSIATNFPFLTITNTFVDQREIGKTNITTQIDVGRYAYWLATNWAVLAKYPPGSGTYPTILYVRDYRTNNLTSAFPVVRLLNGTAPPANGGLGFTVATPNPLYVLGNYNCTNPAFLGTTNTSASVPCALISDALTILSTNWNDYLSTSNYTVRVAASNNTVNAAIITGIVPSTGSAVGQFSGGVQNLPRLLENWTGNHLWLNTSLVNLFNCQRATNPFIDPNFGGRYYAAPTRHFNFDSNFRDPAKLPPGTPVVSVSLPAN